MQHPVTSKRSALCAVVGAAFLSVGALAQGSKTVESSSPTRMTPAEFPWPAAASPGQAGSSMQSAVQSLVVFGDATRPGLYSIVFKVAADVRIPAHSHPDDRSCFVLSGVWYFGYGDVYAEADLRALPIGSHYTEPANANHFAGTRSEGATAECTSLGPSGTSFAKPADDPRIPCGTAESCHPPSPRS
jgi:quercetin dioxygenase-like cupin family protein